MPQNAPHREWIGRGTMLLLGAVLLFAGIRLLAAARGFQEEDRDLFQNIQHARKPYVHTYLYFFGTITTLAGAVSAAVALLPARLIYKITDHDDPTAGRQHFAYRLLRRIFR
jgi:hypothetical protein